MPTTPVIDNPPEETAEEENFAPQDGSDTAEGADQFLRNQNQDQSQEREKDGGGSRIDDLQNAKDAIKDARELSDKFGGGAKAAGQGAQAAGEGASAAGAGGAGGTAGGAAGAAGGTAAGAAGGTAAGTAGGAAAGTAAGAAGGVGAGASAGATAGLAGGPFAEITVPVGAAIGATVVPLYKKFAPEPVKVAVRGGFKGLKYIFAWCCSCLSALFVLPFIILFLFFMAISGGSDPASGSGPVICSPIDPTVNDAHVAQINANISTYKAVEILTGVPWEVLAAIHFKETGLDPSHPNPFQITGWAGGSFSDNAIAAANLLQAKAQEPPWSGVPGITAPLAGFEDPAGPLSADMDWQANLMQRRIKNAMWGYNGRYQFTRDIAAELGFDATMEGYEGSGYVMNNWDEPRQGMEFYAVAGEPPVILVDDGAWKVFVLLKAADYNSLEQITQLNTACITDGSVPFGCPVSGPITSGFGPRDLNADGDFLDPAENHRGIDIDGASSGDFIYDLQVKSTLSGVVTSVQTDLGPSDGRGNFVEVTNSTDPENIYVVAFYHLTSGFLVNEDDTIEIGTPIGIQDTTGLNIGGGDAQHTHYGIRQNGVWVEPAPFMGLTGIGQDTVGQLCTSI